MCELLETIIKVSSPLFVPVCHECKIRGWEVFPTDWWIHNQLNKTKEILNDLALYYIYLFFNMWNKN